MARWEPDAPQRLMYAALELFVEQGYEHTTVPEIAARAGLTKSTFFRHFADKREALFFGQDLLAGVIAHGIASASDSATPLDAIAEGLAAAEVAFSPQRRLFASQRHAVIAANTELQEREALKQSSLVTTMSTALQEHGVPQATATVAAELGVLSFKVAFARWVKNPGDAQTFAQLARETLAELRTAQAALS